MSTVRQQIVSAMVTRLKTLTTANGYASNAGALVFSQFPEGLQIEDWPCLLISDRSETITPSGRSQIEHRLSITVQGLIASGTTTDQACRQLIGDIVECLMDPEDRTMSDVCDTLQPDSGGEIEVEQQTDKTVGSVALSFAATYRTNRGDWSTKI